MAKNNEYVVLSGIDYPPNKRAESGDVVTDLPKEAIAWLLDCGAIAPVGQEAPAAEAVVEAVVEALSNDLPLEEEITDAE